MAKYFMNKQTGELLTYSEMLVEALREYDIPDYTNMFTYADYYEETEINFKIEGNLIDGIRKKVDNYNDAIDGFFTQTVIELCVKNKIKMEEMAVVFTFSADERAKMREMEERLNESEERLAMVTEELEKNRNSELSAIELLEWKSEELSHNVSTIACNLWEYRKKCCEQHIARITA